MSFTLEDTRGESVTVNAWNWGVLHYTVACARPPLFDDELLEVLRFGHLTLSPQQARALHDYLAEVVLPRIPPGHRMLHDLTVTDEPDDGTFHREQLEKNYSLQHDVLARVIEFLGAAEGEVSLG